MELFGWNGFFAPAKTPPAVVAAIQAEMAKAARDPDVKRRLAEVGAEVMGSTQEELAQGAARPGRGGEAAGRRAEARRAIAAMERLLTLAGAFGLSLIVALVAAWRLVEHFWYGEDLDLFVPPVAGFVLVATVVFGGRRCAPVRCRALRHGRARARRIAALLLVATPFLAEYVAAQSKNPEVVLRPRSGKIKAVLLIPMLLAIAAQWWFVRRRWLQARGLDHGPRGRGSPPLRPAS